VKKPLTAAAAAKEKAKKHAAAEKAARTRAKDKAEHKPVHHAKVKVSHKPVVKRRKWSPDEGVALCSARAVAEALRLATGRVLSDADVVSLYWSTASDPDEGQTLSDALSAACGIFGIATDRVRLGAQRVGDIPDLDGVLGLRGEAVSHTAEPGVDPAKADRVPQIWGHPLILGLDLPCGEPHAVTYDPRDGTWWSWGQPYSPADFPGAVIEEAWAVSWAQGGDALCAG
jgi:hypothetical protein